MKYKKYLIVAISLLLHTACSNNSKKNIEGVGLSSSSVSNERDSIFLLSVTEVNDSNQIYMLSYYLDTLNYRLSVVGTRHQEVSFYRCYSINPKESIEYDDNEDGHVKLLLRKGLITERLFVETNASIKHEYDSLQRLKGIIYVGGRKIVSWKDDRLQRVSYIDSTSSRFNQTHNMHYDSPQPSQGYSPELLNSFVTDTQGELLFAYLGLYGRLPLGNDYIEEIITYDYRGVGSKKHIIYNEEYSNDGTLMKYQCHLRGNETGQKRSYSWNLTNLKYLLFLTEDTIIEPNWNEGEDL